MKHTQYLCARLAALVLVLVLAGCNGPPGALRFGIQNAPLTLDPRYASDATSARINRLFYERLVDFDAQGLAVPGLAHWQRLSPTHYRFTLGEQGRSFHDGTRLGAEDVAATYRHVLDPARASPLRGPVEIIEHIAVLDADTLDFHLRRADALFPAYLSLGIVPARFAADTTTLARRPLGSGAFAFVAWPEEGRLVIERRTDHARIEFLRVADPSVRALKLLRGELDLTQNDLPPELVTWLARRDALRVERRPGANYGYLGFNLRDPALARHEVRAAIAHALDREAIIRHVFTGLARPAEGLFPPEHWAGHAGLRAYPHDPQRARELLAQAGFGPGHPLRLSFKTSADPFRLRLAAIYQAQLSAVGIELAIQSYDWGTFYGDIKAGRFQLYGLAWVGIKTPDIFRHAFHSASTPPAGANRGRFANPAVDRTIEAAEGQPDIAAQRPLWRALAAQLHDDLPYLPLWYEDHVLITRREVTGFRLAPYGDYDGLITTQRRR
jgi:peptide/nickel transport system substrate-binding protein